MSSTLCETPALWWKRGFASLPHLCFSYHLQRNCADAELQKTLLKVINSYLITVDHAFQLSLPVQPWFLTTRSLNLKNTDAPIYLWACQQHFCEFRGLSVLIKYPVSLKGCPTMGHHGKARSVDDSEWNRSSPCGRLTFYKGKERFWMVWCSICMEGEIPVVEKPIITKQIHLDLSFLEALENTKI